MSYLALRLRRVLPYGFGAGAAAAVAGGLGRPYGTLLGALLVGLVLELAGAYSNSSYQLAFALGVLVLLLLFRPNGLLVSGRQAIR